MIWPKISVVTPSFNQGQFIERTVRSVLLQRYPALEYIVMDGGSRDDTLARLEPYADRLAHLVSESDGGQADAIAKGFARSTGEIMAYLNSDDVLAPDTLTFVAEFFRRNPGVDALYSHRCTIDADDRVRWYWILPPHQDFLMRRWDLIPQETCFWRRRVFDEAGNIDPSFRFAMDYDLFVRYMRVGRFRRANRFLGAFRQHDGSKTSRLLTTVGHDEMTVVRQKHRIRPFFKDSFFGSRFFESVKRAGQQFAASAKRLPGTLGGVGFDYNDVWSGALRPDKNSCVPQRAPQGSMEAAVERA